jgi:TPP-dependent pyruvate/acetoin dehydrogenase alpha subunit
VPGVTDVTGEDVHALGQMLLIRELEQRLDGYGREKLIRGSAHPSVGMEAVAVGVSAVLEPRDAIASTHRGHAHCLARGADPGRLLAEIFGRRDGYCGGKGGSMHVAVPELGILGTNGIVGASIGIATGAALAAQLAGDGSVAVAYFGDGATNQGLFHESLNLASLWSLPVVYVCENNHFAQSARLEDMVRNPELSSRAASYGIPGVDVDGMDVRAVRAAAATAVARAREGGGPTLLVADTYRYFGHMIADTQIYRSPDEIGVWRARDPIERLAGELVAAGRLDPAGLDDARDRATETVDAAELFARRSLPPDMESARSDVEGARR